MTSEGKRSNEQLSSTCWPDPICALYYTVSDNAYVRLGRGTRLGGGGGGGGEYQRGGPKNCVCVCEGGGQSAYGYIQSLVGGGGCNPLMANTKTGRGVQSAS